MDQLNARRVLADEDHHGIVESSIFIRKNSNFFVELMLEGQKFYSAYFTNMLIPLLSDLVYPKSYKPGEMKCLSHGSKLTKSVLIKKSIQHNKTKLVGGKYKKLLI